MNKDLQIMLLEKRIAVLEANEKDNGKIVTKLRRKVRNLKNSDKSE